VAAINHETAFTGGGLTTPVDWRTGHTTATPPYCHAAVRVANSQFVPVIESGTNQVFVCYGANSTTPIAPKPGTPGT
jgi:hypothetical protein